MDRESISDSSTYPDEEESDVAVLTQDAKIPGLSQKEKEQVAAAKRGRGSPSTTDEYVGRAKAMERLAAAKERELRALEEARILKEGYVPP